MLDGGCYCKAIRYRVPEQIFNSTSCHCDMCRGTTGAVRGLVQRTVGGICVAFRPADPVPVEFPAARTFCPACGTQLTFVDDATPGETDVTTCSLDEPNRIAPRDYSGPTI